MKKLVALEPRIAGFKDYEDREIEKNEVRIRVIQNQEQKLSTLED